MKNKKIICLLLVFLMMMLTFNINSYGVTEPSLRITSNQYSVGNKMALEEVNNVEVSKTLQLYAVIGYGNDIYDPEHPDSMGWYVKEVNLSGVTWTSSNNEIATVDNTGKVTGVAEGKATITATYNEKNTQYEVNVKAKSDEKNTRISFARYEPEPAKILNKEYGFIIYLYNIPDTEKGNIKVAIENEKIAKLTGIDLCNWEDGSGKGMIKANAKLLSLGKTKITATLNYNGKTYSDTFDFDVVESAYSILLSAKEYTDLPSNLKVGDKIQLIAMLHTYGGSLIPEDVTAKGVTWTSSDEKVVKIDDKGLVTAIGEGTATITAKYTVRDETITAKYNLKITDPTKSLVNPGNSSDPTKPASTKGDSTTSTTILPKAGQQNIILILLLFSLIIVTIAYTGYRKYKKIG